MLLMFRIFWFCCSFCFVILFLVLYVAQIQTFLRCVIDKDFFYHSAGCLFAQMMVCPLPYRSKLFTFMWSYLLIVYHNTCVIQVLCRKFIPVPKSSMLFPTIPPTRFRVSGFMLRFLIHLELCFVQGGKYESMWILLQAAIQFDEHHFFFVKDAVFFQGVLLAYL